MKRLYILDANALLHRSWHAIHPLTNPKGQVVNCVYGMLLSVMKLLNEQKPDAFIACWDTKAPTFRHIAYEAYKANREHKEEELYEQIPWVKEGFALLGVESFEKDGYEADDLIGTFAERSKNKGWDVTIVTGDRDALQLVCPGISVMAFVKGVTETKRYDIDAIQEEYGLTPEQFLEYKAMRGDTSDNIPGIRGIGDVGATDLLQKYGDLKHIFVAAHDASSELSKSLREKLLHAEKDVPAILSLVTIDRNVPILYEVKDGTFPKDKEGLQLFLSENGFKTLLEKIPGVYVKKEKNIKPVQPASLSLHQIALRDISVEKSFDVKNALDRLRKSQDVIVRVVRASQGSLFGNEAGGIVLADDQTAYLFSASCVRSSVELLQEFFSEEVRQFVAHDAKEEMRLAEGLGLTLLRWSFDTMLASYLLSAGERNHDLVTIGTKYCSVVLEQESGPLLEVSVIRACINPLRSALEAEQLLPILNRFELPLIPVLRAMEKEGILIHRDYLHSLSTEMSLEKRSLEKQMIEIAGRDFNPGSPSQLADLLFVTLALPTKGIKKGKSAYSTASNELEKLRGLHPIIELIEAYRELSKLLSTYVDVLPSLADVNGRIHTTYNQAITSTGRLSSVEPNLQNIPIRTEVGRKIRHAFIAKPGFTLVSCDYSQIELRLVAALSHDTEMMKAFERGDDVHTATAASIWKIAFADVTKEQRRIAKAINFGLIFGQGPQGLAQTAGITFKEAREFIDRYFEVYIGIKVYMAETKESAKKLGYVETLFGRRRYIPELYSTLPMVRAQAERMAINMPVQGTDADLMKLAMIKLALELPEYSPESRVLLQVHDELVLEVPVHEVQRVSAFVCQLMETVESVGVPIKVEAKFGDNWDEMTSV